MFAVDPLDLVHWTVMLVIRLFLLMMIVYPMSLTMIQILHGMLMALVVNMSQLALRTCHAFQVNMMYFAMDLALGWDPSAVALF